MKTKLKQIHNDIIKPLAFAFMVAYTVFFCYWTFTEVAHSRWGIFGVGFFWVSAIWILTKEMDKSVNDTERKKYD